MYDDPNTVEDYSTDSLGSFFAGLVTPSVTAVPGGASSAQALFFSFSMFDPNDSAEIIDSGFRRLGKVCGPQRRGATPGQWGIVAAVVADNEVEPAAESSLAGMTTTLVAVPEPETYAMFGAGLMMLGLGMVRRRAR
ncbi:MAG: PEP-CTERM sorting domain-containing protein [Betaproteobacteria bacterium]|nr:PEP-CTERM sorting domain-containing protein [Betaproteobacteria bacterium]